MTVRACTYTSTCTTTCIISTNFCDIRARVRERVHADATYDNGDELHVLGVDLIDKLGKTVEPSEVVRERLLTLERVDVHVHHVLSTHDVIAILDQMYNTPR